MKNEYLQKMILSLIIDKCQEIENADYLSGDEKKKLIDIYLDASICLQMVKFPNEKEVGEYIDYLYQDANIKHTQKNEL